MEAPPVGARKPGSARSIGGNVYGSRLNRADRYALCGQVVPLFILGMASFVPWCSPNPGKPLERSRRPHRLSVLTSSEAFCRAERPQIGKPQSLHRSSWWPRRCDHGGPLSIPWSTLQSDSGARQGITDDSSGTSRAPVAATKQEVESRLTDSCDSIKLFLLQENLWVIERRPQRANISIVPAKLSSPGGW